MSGPGERLKGANRRSAVAAANGADVAEWRDEAEEVAPMRRRAPGVDRERDELVDVDAQPAADELDMVERDVAQRPAALSRQRGRGSRPIQRQDVYRHPVVGGREVRDTLWRRLMAAFRRALTSRGEREEAELDERLRRPATVTRMNVIAVVSPKGGVGKTTSTWVVSDALSNLGRVSVCAMDANPDFGSLGSLVPEARRSDRTLADLLADYADQEPPNAAELQAYLSALPSGLRVLEAPSDPDVMATMGPHEYERLLTLLERQVAVVVLDCGTGMASPLARWAMRRADQVLIVTTPDWVTANNVSTALKHVPAERATLVLNQVRSGVAGDRQAITDHFAAQAVERRHAVPYDEALRTMLDSATYELQAARRPTRLAIKRLAAQAGEDLR
jgi:MinD-like ATPase involved in chromosome partitioning or flagellar assembly